MKRPPRKADDGIFAGGMGFDIAFQGIIVTIITLASYFIGDYIERGSFAIGNSADGTTMAFLTLSLIEMFHSFNMRSRRGSIFTMKTQNWWLWASLAASFVMTVAVIYVPFLRTAFKFAEISFVEFLVAVGLALTIIPIMEITKFIQRRIEKKKN